MKKPIIFTVDDDAQVLKTIARDLKNRYRKDYKILSTTSAKEALDSLRSLKNQGDDVALFLSDQRMPEMLGVTFLTRAKTIYPEAKRILLTAYSDTDAAIKAINDVQLDYYLTKPWNPPEEKLYPVIDDQLEEWQSTYTPEFKGIKILGYQWSPKSHALKDFLSGNLIPYQWLDVESNEKSKELMELNGIDQGALPVVFFEDGTFLEHPEVVQVGERIGMRAEASKKMYDVAIIGAGPAGLAAAVYGGSEGLDTLLIEKRAPGGQAGTSSRIENYLGFPKGLSGAELSHRVITQAKRFGIEFLSPQEVTDVQLKDGYKIIKFSDGQEINTRSIVVTTGVDYRKLTAQGIDDFTGAGIYYGAATTEAQACKGQDVYIVGGGNSAGQAAMYLSKYAENVYILVRRPDLSSSMSQYLIDQIKATHNVHLEGKTVITKAIGEGKLNALELESVETGEVRTVKASVLLIFIGARPYTDWLQLDIIKNERGFIETGTSVSNTNLDFKCRIRFRWSFCFNQGENRRNSSAIARIVNAE